MAVYHTPSILLAIAQAHFAEGAHPQAKETLDRLAALASNFRLAERQLLTARTLEQLNDLDGARREYEALSKRYPGEEARCRYALLLDRMGEAEKAREIYARILLDAKRSPRYYRKAQKEWITIARQKLGK